MKIYTASKFSIVIVPPKMSEKTKESKLLIRSFRHIYIVGLGIATGFSGLFSLCQFQNKTICVDDFAMYDEISSIEESAKNMRSMLNDESMKSIFAPSQMIAEYESQDITERSMDVVNTAVNSELTVNSDFFLPFVVITTILGGLTVYYLLKFRKSNLT